jgi:hypothetical protein
MSCGQVCKQAPVNTSENGEILHFRALFWGVFVSNALQNASNQGEL